jgi:hypothetical protein
MATTFQSLIPNDYNYALGKLYEGIARDYPLARMNFDRIKDAHGEIQQELIARYGSLQAAPGSDVVNSIRYILDRFTGWFNQNNVAGNEDAYVFRDALDFHSQELFEMLKEMDAKV